MTVYVRRNGVLVDKQTGEPMRHDGAIGLAAPRVSRMEAFESPITGKEVTSWGQRDREMRENNCFDPRDLPADHQFRRGREVQLKEAKEVRANGERTDEFKWRDTPGE
jgi:hypothetical protein